MQVRAVIASLVLLLGLFSVANATYGVDVSSYVSQSAWNCLKGEGFHFGIVRGYQSTGHVDPNVVSTVANARAAGISYVDVYMFPCPKCGNPEGQVETLVNHLRNNKVNFGMVWFDIEGSGYWLGNCASNQNFLQAAVNKAKAMGVHIGVYSSASQWSPIMCGWTGVSGLPLWYAHYDNNPSFSDFSPFGGWSKPAIKQYVGDASSCGVGIDKNWYP